VPSGFRQQVSDPDNAGGSAEASQTSGNSMRVAAYAWHGYNGYGAAWTELEAVVPVATLFEGVPASFGRVAVIGRVTVSLRGTLKAPWDRTAKVVVSGFVSLDGVGAAPEDIYRDQRADAEGDGSRAVSYDGTAAFSLDVERVASDQMFTVSVWLSCTATSGAQAVALLNEGSCDASLQVPSIELTVTPLD